MRFISLDDLFSVSFGDTTVIRLLVNRAERGEHTSDKSRYLWGFADSGVGNGLQNRSQVSVVSPTTFSSTVRQLELAPMRRRRYTNLSLEQTPEEGRVFITDRVGDVVDSSMALLE
ncbi:hypothetical protein LY622_00680 [Halomonas sp. M5N1S17]|nr:hypothetical protein [Halomonas alkalisoli]MCE9661944.1 hypothetical protein [Halomonas alkalisoli]